MSAHENPVDSDNATTGEDPVGHRYEHEFGECEVVATDERKRTVTVSLVDRDDHEAEVSRSKFERDFEFVG